MSASLDLRRGVDSIGSSVKRRLLCSLLVVVVSAGACGVVKDDVAAVVNGREISVRSVNELAAHVEADPQLAQSLLAGSNPPSGTIAGDAARMALNLLVREDLITVALRSHDGTVTEADRTSAADQAKGYSTGFRPFAERILAANVALARVATKDLPTPTLREVADFYSKNKDRFAAETCFDALRVTADGAADAQKALGSGTSAAKYLAGHGQTTAAADSSGLNVCLSAEDIAGNQQLQGIVQQLDGVDIGGVVPLQQNDGSAVFLVITKRTITPLTPALSEQIAEYLKSQNTAAASAQVDKELTVLEGKATVSIDPRYGTWAPGSEELIAAPPVPTGRTTTTLPELAAR